MAVPEDPSEAMDLDNVMSNANVLSKRAYGHSFEDLRLWADPEAADQLLLLKGGVEAYHGFYTYKALWMWRTAYKEYPQPRTIRDAQGLWITNVMPFSAKKLSRNSAVLSKKIIPCQHRNE